MILNFKTIILTGSLGWFTIICVAISIVSVFRFLELSETKEYKIKEKIARVQGQIYLLSMFLFFIIGLAGFVILDNLFVLVELFAK